MDLNKGMQQLSDMFKHKSWFYDVSVDEYNRLVVYIKESNNETIRDIPDNVDGVQVLVHFAASKMARSDQYVSTPKPVLSLSKPVDDLPEEGYLDPGDLIDDLPPALTKDIGALARELDRLEKICGSNILQDIFYEVHDGKNSVTNLSAKFPDVRKSLDSLYQEYGFDVIYEELDG